MLLKIAQRMLFHKKARTILTVLGLATLFFLSATQVGLLIGWINTITGIMRHTDADIWLMAENTVSWDYGTPIPRHRTYQARNVPGVASTQSLYVGFGMWQKPDGTRLNIQLIGLDQQSIGGPWSMRQGTVESVHIADSVIVDELFLDMLGVGAVGEEFELLRSQKRAMVRGISREVRTFTASPYVFTSIQTAPKYDPGFHDQETTYVLVKCQSDADPQQVAQAIRSEVPGVEVLTTRQFMVRSVLFWLVRTGMGLLVLATATLGVIVGVVVAAQTLFNMTQDYLPHYATLMAVGFSVRQIHACVLLQAIMLSSGGVLLGAAVFYGATIVTSRTPAPVEMTPSVFALLIVVTLVGSLLGSILSARPVSRIDPSIVFRG